jgi:hypothetical protein
MAPGWTFTTYGFLHGVLAADARILTFHKRPLLITPAAGYQNYAWTADSVAVKVRDEETLDLGLNLFQRYARCTPAAIRPRTNWASSRGKRRDPGRRPYKWKIGAIDDGATDPIHLTLPIRNPNGTPIAIDFILTGETGAARYRVTYTARTGCIRIPASLT